MTYDSRSRPVETQAGIKPGSVVTPQALRCSALDRCATLEAPLELFQCKTNQLDQCPLAVPSADFRQKALDVCHARLTLRLSEHHKVNGNTDTARVHMSSCIHCQMFASVHSVFKIK